MFGLDSNDILANFIEPDDVIEREEVQEGTEEEVTTEETTETNEEEVVEPIENDDKKDEDFIVLPDEDVETNKVKSIFGEIEIPEKFEKPEEELEFYKSKFNELNEKAKSEEFIEDIATNYSDKLIEQETKVEELKALRDMLDGKDDTYLKMKLKDNLIKSGYDHRLTQEEVYSYLDQGLAEKFGFNYGELYNDEDSMIPGTISYKMREEQARLQAEVQSHNTRPQTSPESQIDPVEAKRIVYETLAKKGLNEKQVDSFIDKAAKEWDGIVNDPVKMYNIIYMDKIIEQKEKKAYEKGKNEALEDFKKASTKKPIDDNSNKEEDESKEESVYDWMAKKR